MLDDIKSAVKGKKRGRATTAAASASSSSKRSKRGASTDDQPSSSSAATTTKSRPAPAGSQQWKPPSGLWEDAIAHLDAMLDEVTGSLVFYATWKNGQKTRHEKGVIYVKCPQKVISFYERHVKFVPSDKVA